MKIGIMSMQRIENYGSFMQALSLKQIIESLGHEVVFVDYHIKPIISKKGDFKEVIKTNWLNIKKTIKRNDIVMKILNGLNMYSVSEKEQKFSSCNNYLSLKIQYKYNTKVDILIIGSDEVFNCLQTNTEVGYSLELFGKHCNTKRLISYAASFGSTTIEEINKYEIDNELAYYLNKFDNISVRDKNSLKIVESLCSQNVQCHLDPVLVGNLEKQEWKKININNYLLVYGYSNRFTEEEGKYIRKFAKSRDLTIISLGGQQHFADKNIICRPDEVISYFQNASYIITDTFHGSIFSIICHKQFVTFCRKKDNVKQGQATNEEKLVDMLSKLELTNCIIDLPQEIEKIIDNPIDYVRIEVIRSRERDRTIKYLKENLTL